MCRFSYSLTFSHILTAVVLTACGGGTVLVESTPRPEPASDIESVAPPNGSFAVIAPEMGWTPATISTGRANELAERIQSQKTLALILPRTRMSTALEDRVFQMVRIAAPETKVVVRARGTLDKLLVERGEIPYRKTLEMAGTDAYGEAFYLPKKHPLNTEWLAKRRPLKGADAMLTVRQIMVDDSQLHELRKGRQGSCSGFIEALVDNQKEAHLFFEAYIKETNELLKTAFTRHLTIAIPYWKDEIEVLAQRIPLGGVEEQCLKNYRNLVDKYAVCLDGPCSVSPRLHLESGGIVGIEETTLLVPDTCPPQEARDYAAEITDLAQRAVAEVFIALDDGWAREIARFNSLVHLGHSIEEACTPRHRRIRTAELKTAQSAVRKFLSELPNRDFSAEWVSARGQERIPGTGPIRVLARIKTSPIGPLRDTTTISQQLRSLDHCDDRGEHLWQTTLIDVGTSEILFVGIFFEEELLCDGFPPGSP
jgi:hypothetical protein